MSVRKPAKAPSLHYLVVEGPIGVGKTSLVRRLAARLEAEMLLEKPEANPFLERFYRDPRGAALPTQLFFLFQRAEQLAGLQQQSLFASLRIADFLLEKDRLFAQMNLDDAEFALYEQVAARLAIAPPKPDLVVYLQAPVDVLVERIQKRRIASEQQIERPYLERLNAAYARFFHDYSAAPLLIVNASVIDPVSNDGDLAELVQAIQRASRGRQYFNPMRNRGI